MPVVDGMWGYFDEGSALAESRIMKRKEILAAWSRAGSTAWLLLFPALGLAQANTWTGGGEDAYWFNPENWSSAVPTSGIVEINNNAGEHAILDGLHPDAVAVEIATLRIGQTGFAGGDTGLLTIQNGGSLSAAGFLGANVFIGSQNNGHGELWVTGADSIFAQTGNGGIQIGAGGVGVSNGVGVVTIDDGGTLSAASNVTLATGAAGAGTLNIGTGTGAGFFNAPAIVGGAGAATINFNHTDSDYLFGANISGNTLTLNHLNTGVTRLTGNTTYGGATTISAGTLAFGGTTNNLGGSVTVATGGKVAIDGDGTRRTLTIGGDLTVASGGVIGLALGAPVDSYGIPADSDYLLVQGDVIFEGDGAVVFNLDMLGGFNDGEHILMAFDGTLTGSVNDLVINPPTGFTMSGIDVVTEAGRRYIVMTIGGTVGSDVWWDGAGNPGDGQISGGSGIWDTTSSNWTNEDGTTNAVWQEEVAIFAGDEGGTVTLVEDTRFTRLRFLDNDYALVTDNDSVLSANEDVLAVGEQPRVEVGGGVTATIGVDIDSGSRGLRKDGSGTLVLVTDQSYTGLTDIRGGRVELGAGGTAGMVAGDVDIGSGALAFNRSDDVTFGQTISGSGHVEQMGSGQLSFNTAQQYTGETRVRDGVLRLDAGGSLHTQSAVQIQPNGRFEINWSGDNSFVNSISGSGELRHLGAGTTTLTRNPTGFNGTIDIANGALALDATGTASLGAAFTGGGDLIKRGTNTLTLTADSSAFSGVLRIETGVLNLNNDFGGDVDVQGTLGLDGVIGGSLQIRDGGAAGGRGRVEANAHVHAGAMLTLQTVTGADPIGGTEPTLAIGGDLVIEDEATLRLGVNRFGEADWLHVGGTARLEGGTVLVLEAGSQDALWQAFTPYLILRAEGGVEGGFGSVQNSFAFLDPELTQDGYTVTLTLVRNDVMFGDLPGLTPNQAATGAAARFLEIDAAEDWTHPVVDSLLMMAPHQVPAALSALSGEHHASLRGMLIDDSRLLRDAVLDATAAGRSGLWLRLLGHDGRMMSQGTSTLERRSNGLLFGNDYAREGDGHAVHFGWALGYSSTTAKVDALHSDAEADNLHVAVYGGLRPEQALAGGVLGLRGGVAYSRHELETRRGVIFDDYHGGYHEVGLNADYNAHTVQAFAEADWAVDMGAVALAPFLNLAWVQLQTEGFVEGGQGTTYGESAALRASSDRINAGISTLGLRFSAAVSESVLPLWSNRLRMQDFLSVQGGLGWRYVFTGETPEARMAFVDNSVGFDIHGTALSRNALVADLGVEAALGSRTRLGLSWTGQFDGPARLGNGSRDHALHANLFISLP